MIKEVFKKLPENYINMKNILINVAHVFYV